MGSSRLRNEGMDRAGITSGVRWNFGDNNRDRARIIAVGKARVVRETENLAVPFRGVRAAFADNEGMLLRLADGCKGESRRRW